MPKIDILFIYLGLKKVSTSYRSQGTPPLGIAYLAAICERDGHTADFIDLNVERKSEKEIADQIRRTNPSYLGISFVTEGRFEAFKIFTIAKEINPNITTIAGGPHPTLCTEDTLSHVPDIDIIVRGEGESTFSELLKALRKTARDLSGIRGISYRQSGLIRQNENRPPITDLDSLPFPALHLLSFDRYGFHLDVPGRGKLKAAPVLSSRGCPFRCNFCSTTKVWGARWRSRSPENVIAEIEQLIGQFGVRAIWFVDDNFNSNVDRVNRICDEFLKRKLDIKWVCNIRVDNVKREHLDKMAAAGCFHIEYGAESGSQRILDEIIRKKIKVNQIIDVDRWCHELGIMTDAQFVISHPTETFEEAKETIALMKTLKGKSTLQIMKIYPGTNIEEIAIAKGILPNKFSWSKDKGATDYIPTITGEAPLFIDNLTMNQISELMTVAWTEIGSFSIYYLIKKILTKIRTPKEFYSMMKLGVPVLLNRFRNRLLRRSN